LFRSLRLSANDSRQQNSGISHEHTARLKDNRQTEIPCCADNALCITGRRRRLFFVIWDAETAAEIEITQIDAVVLQAADKISNTAQCLFKRADFGDLRSDVT